MADFATAEGTARYASRFPDFTGFYRQAQGLTVSSLGLGTYLGETDDSTDSAYSEAVLAAVNGCVNAIDSAINYRNQRSERSIGAALPAVVREEVVLATKAGFLTPGAVPAALRAEDVVGGMHSMAPAFLADQIERSLANLRAACVDVFYLHNPETQRRFVAEDEFYARIERAFVKLEEIAARGKIQYYGAATWNGFRRNPGAPDSLDLERLTGIATRLAGDRHRFRFIQLPFNLAMTEAFSNGTLESAARAGITVVASASILQGRLALEKAPVAAALVPGLGTAVQRAIQFTRSTPGITTALVGMSSAAHVVENLAVARVPPLEAEDYLRIYDH